MPTIKLQDDLWTIQIITGPKHIWLGIEFSVCEQEPKLVQRDPIGQCDHGKLDPQRIKSAVLNGVAFSGLNIARIEYVANDSPAYASYEYAAKLLAQKASQSGPNQPPHPAI